MTRAGKTLKNFICHNSAPQLPLGQTTRDFLQVRHTCPSRGPATGKSMSLGHGASWEPAWHELQAEKWGSPLPCLASPLDSVLSSPIPHITSFLLTSPFLQPAIFSSIKAPSLITQAQIHPQPPPDPWGGCLPSFSPFPLSGKLHFPEVTTHNGGGPWSVQHWGSPGAHFP